MKHSREWYTPKGSRKITAKDCNATAYLFTAANGNPAAVIFLGNAQKPTKRHWYRTEQQREKHIKHLFDSQRSREESRKQRQAERSNAVRGLEVGDILRSSWGYEQTNIDYYEVTALIGKKMVEIRRISAHSIDTGWAQGKSVPMPGEYISEPIKKRAKNGSVKIESYASAHKMDPVSNVGGVKTYKSSHWTAYH